MPNFIRVDSIRETHGGTHRENIQPKAEANFNPELIRTVAILLVILVHVSLFPYDIAGMIGQATPAAQFNWWTVDAYSSVAYLGVPLFIILSGVLLLDPAKDNESLADFYRKRASRIAIPMAFWTIWYFGWTYYIRSTPLTSNNIFEGLLNGSYFHLWFLYLLIGLYLVTPILRTIVKYLDYQKFTFFLAIWFAGTILEPFMKIFLPDVYFNPVMFMFTGWAGTFLLGVYLLKGPKVQSWKLYLILVAGLLVAVIGDAVAPFYAGEASIGFFHEYLSFGIILAAASLFLLLVSVPKNRLQNGNPTINRVVNWIGKNSLGIYLVHIMVLEIITNGYLEGLKINMGTMSPIVEIPLVTALTFVLTCLLVYGLKKIPYAHKILG